MQSLVSPRQAARALGVSESSLKRWCDRGLLVATKTAGGHRRLPVSGLVGFLKRRSLALVKPEAIGLPPATGSGTVHLESAADELHDHLLEGRTAECRRILFDLILCCHRPSVLCDRVLNPAFTRIGDAWECGAADVYEEHRACELCTRLLYELRDTLPAADALAPFAIGGTPAGDPYALATTMAEIVMRDCGWRASSLGRGVPFEAFAAAVKSARPQLCWLSVSHVDDERVFLRGLKRFAATSKRLGVPVILGGRALTPAIHDAVPGVTFGENMQQLQALAESLYLPPPHREG